MPNENDNKLVTLADLKDAFDTKLDKDFDFNAASLPYSNLEKIALLGTDGANYYTTIGELASQIGGSGGGTSQTALVHYVKNCGSISTLNWTNPTIDNNITENMVVLKAELSNPAAQTSDWTCTTTNGYVTISGTISGSTNVLLYFGVSLSTAPSIIVNLASDNPDNVLKTNPTPGVMGVLGTTHGGTGVNATDAADLRSKLGITPANIGALGSTGVLTPSAAFSIPAAGSSVSYSMAGMTASHILTHWNFSSSPENVPPASLTWTTYEGYFTITNNKGTTAETIKPVFELPTNVSITGI